MNSVNHAGVSVVRAQQRLFQRVFSWMFAGLSMTGIIAYLLGTNERVVAYFTQNQGVLLGIFLAELALVFFLSARVHKMTANTATFLFFLYAALNGITLALIFAVYTRTDIAAVFFITAGTFGASALYGYVTKRDLSRLGSILMMALIGFILATLVNLFLQSEALDWAITYIGIVLFVVLTAYDIQKIKELGKMYLEGEETVTKAAIMGALALYLDFINLFILILRLFANRD